MRYLLSKHSRDVLFSFLKDKHKANSLMELSDKMNLPKSTIDEWRYNSKRYIPEEIISQEIVSQLEILEKQENNWGKIKGGKKAYKEIIKNYGIEEIRKRQIAGGLKSKTKYLNEPFILKIKDPLFLEFYGVLLGDGWLSKLKYKGKVINLIGISGHAKLDREFFYYLQENIKKLFNRKAYLKQRKGNSIELNFSHKLFLEAINNELGFPIGKKINLNINKRIFNLGYDYLRYVIRGIFDKDGSFYLDKTPSGNHYPCISIQMKSPVLIEQLYSVLIDNGFKVVYRKDRGMITLKGKKQLKKWMNEIKSSNSRHLNKIKALVAQSG